MAKLRLSVFRRIRKTLRLLLWVGVGVYFLCGLSFLGVRHLVLPHLPEYRGEIAGLIAHSIGLPVQIRGLGASLDGWRPRLHLEGFTIHDKAGLPALTLDRVEAEVAWVSLPLMRLKLYRLEIDAPELSIRRDGDGQLFVAGLPVQTSGESDGAFADWLLSQREVLIRHARLEWRDGLRKAPPLALDEVDFRLENRGALHRFGLTAHPPEALATMLDVRGELHGSDLKHGASWRGELFAGLDYAKLGAWRPWVDYPLDAEGSGGLKAWLSLGHGRVQSITADFSLKDARIRLAKDLEDIPFNRASGRLRYRDEGGLREASARQLSIETRDGLVLPPTDFFLRLLAPAGSHGGRGELVASQLDLAVLSELAGRLPLPVGVRSRLDTLAPTGQVGPLSLKWALDSGGDLASYTVDARFSGLGIAPLEAWPGFAGLSGRIEGSEKGGHFVLTGKDAALVMPKVFPEPRLALDALAAEGTWTHPEGLLELNLSKATFANRDARGTASGRYRATPDTPGVIDLQARLQDADSTAVWRYMPGVVSKGARDWLERGLLGGKAPDARLVLKGDLSHFPFRDPADGLFRVNVKVVDGLLEYAPGWPRIEDIQGDLVFEGAGMNIKARRGKTLGVELRDVSVVLPDFKNDAVLAIHGQAQGPTQEFLRFLGESPVGGWIGHFTDPFRSEGAGSLDLHLSLPLHDLPKSRVKGEFQFAHNRFQPDPALPVIVEAGAKVGFTESQMTIRQGVGRVFGEAVSVSGGTRPDGGVLLNAQGSVGMAALRKELDLPLLDHMSGTAPWKGTITVPHTGGVEFVLDSSLQGVTASLPPPFGKTASQPLPFHFELLATPGVPGDTLKLSAGGGFQAQFIRRREGNRSLIQRGGLALNEALRIPDQGVMIAASADTLDADAWRKALAGNPPPQAQAGGHEHAPAAGSGFPLSGLALKASDLQLLGQHLHDANLRAVMEQGGWQARLQSREATGEFVWRDQGRGRLQARFRQLVLGSATGNGMPPPSQESKEKLAELPGLDISADSLVIRGHQLGKLELKASNQGDVWSLDQFLISNPDGSLSGKGSWRPGSREETRINVRLDVASPERMLARLGYPEAVRQAHTTLEGELGWQGAPVDLDFASLNGHMQLHVDKGQFTRLEPGVGRLLGVLSLQALPRRVTLDFRDVFSEGFAFDRISGSIQMNGGVLHTEDLALTGAAARVFITGDADLARESQNLKVKVQPTLTESVAVGSVLATGVGAVHPAVGLATYLVQKALRDPVEQLFSFEYAITGSWSDPKVDKLSARALPSAVPEGKTP